MQVEYQNLGLGKSVKSDESLAVVLLETCSLTCVELVGGLFHGPTQTAENTVTVDMIWQKGWMNFQRPII